MDIYLSIDLRSRVLEKKKATRTHMPALKIFFYKKKKSHKWIAPTSTIFIDACYTQKSL